VGKLAGLPQAVVRRAEKVLNSLEKGEQSSVISKLADDLPLFQMLTEASSHLGNVKRPSVVDIALDEANPDEMTPRQAHDYLYKLKEIRLSNGGE
jgi:DNA mismatch repair protein MutS